MLGLLLSPFLKTGVILADSQSLGVKLEFRDCIKMTVKIGAISSAQSLSIRAGI